MIKKFKDLLCYIGFHCWHKYWTQIFSVSNLEKHGPYCEPISSERIFVHYVCCYCNKMKIRDHSIGWLGPLSI